MEVGRSQQKSTRQAAFRRFGGFDGKNSGMIFQRPGEEPDFVRKRRRRNFLRPDCQKSPSRTTCAYGWDTYREIWRRECARPKGRVRGSAPNFVPRGQTQRPRPAVWRSAPVFASGHRPAPRKSAKRKRNAVCLLQGRYDARRKSREPQPEEFLPRDCAQKWVPPKACRFSTRSAQGIPAPSLGSLPEQAGFKSPSGSGRRPAGRRFPPR